jgi:hypothetical protein
MAVAHARYGTTGSGKTEQRPAAGGGPSEGLAGTGPQREPDQ